MWPHDQHTLRLGAVIVVSPRENDVRSCEKPLCRCAKRETSDGREEVNA